MATSLSDQPKHQPFQHSLEPHVTPSGAHFPKAASRQAMLGATSRACVPCEGSKGLAGLSIMFGENITKRFGIIF